MQRSSKVSENGPKTEKGQPFISTEAGSPLILCDTKEEKLQLTGQKICPSLA